MYNSGFKEEMFHYLSLKTATYHILSSFEYFVSYVLSVFYYSCVSLFVVCAQKISNRNP